MIERTAEGFALRDLAGVEAGTAVKGDVIELKPNAGVRGLIEAALVLFTLSDPDPARRAEAPTSIARDPAPELLEPLRAALKTETDPDSAARVAAIEGFGADLGLDLRGALNPLVATRRIAAAGDPPPGSNLARELRPGPDLPNEEADDLLVDGGLAPARLTVAGGRAALVAPVENGTVAGVPLADLAGLAARDRAPTGLESAGLVPLAATDDEATAGAGGAPILPALCRNRP